ncbi:MAG: hypothetical protein EP338_06905 [Bacteroidetes bacterium]|nr:MAG: hypothetical protein EP338_06905 [Bacteroidota bacterium]
MTKKYFDAFEAPAKEAWLEVLTKELKGKDFDQYLLKKDAIEELEFTSYNYPGDSNQEARFPGRTPYRRGNSMELNDWGIVYEVREKSEEEANKKALEMLMKGVSVVIFDVRTWEANSNFKSLLNGVRMDCIRLGFRFSDRETLERLNSFLEDVEYQEVLCFYDPLGQSFSEGLSLSKSKRLLRSFEVNAYAVQQAGANATQELAFALAAGNEYIHRLLESGSSVDDALAGIHFTFGISPTYFVEVAKFRAFRELWAQVARSYDPEHKCNETAMITARTGFVNKSLLDPYTNLLRQSTEAMSAVLGGAQDVHVQAYDQLSEEGASELAERMSINISLILKEESYLNQVLDTTGGSYAIEELTDQLCEKAWSLFQEIEREGGLLKSASWKDNIRNTAAKRIEHFREGKRTLIGVNKYPSPEEKQGKWQLTEITYHGLSSLVLEKELKIQEKAL